MKVLELFYSWPLASSSKTPRDALALAINQKVMPAEICARCMTTSHFYLFGYRTKLAPADTIEFQSSPASCAAKSADEQVHYCIPPRAF
jgi:hypothetical protein